MANFIDHETQTKIRQDFADEMEKSISSATSIRKVLSARYGISYSVIHKITTCGYKLKAAQTEYKETPKDTKVKKFKKNLQFPKTLIFTSWEIRVGLNKSFIDILKQIANYYEAELFLSSVWPDDLQFLPPEFDNFQVLMADWKINDNLMFKYVPTHALCSSPIAGWAGAHDSSIIVPGLIKDLVTEKSNKFCKQIISTGSVGRLNAFLTHYNHVEDEENRTKLMKRWSFVQNRRGGRAYEIAKQFTVPCALIVDVLDNKTFLTRYVTMEKDGTVYDKNLKFMAGKPYPERSRPEAIVLGDQHAYIADETATKASLEMCESLNPKAGVVNDFFDGSSVNHHEWNDFANVVEFPSITEEAQITRMLLDKYIDVLDTVYYKQSNHDDFLIKYLSNENNYKLGKNYKEAISLRLWQLENKRHPVIKVLELDKIKNLKFVSSKENLVIAGVSVIHGHEGVSGRRAGFRAQQRIYNRLVQAHEHSPNVYRNGALCGTNSILNPNYTIGASGWMAANVLIQPDGSLQLLPIINGVWSL